MAPWQASFHLVPSNRVPEVFPDWFPFGTGEVEHLPVEDISEIDWWGPIQPTAGFRAAIERFAVPARGSAPDVEWYGTEDGDRFEVRIGSDGSVSALSVCFDVRHPDLSFVRGVTDLAQDLGCDYVAYGMLYQGTPGGLTVGLRNSPALRFASDAGALLTQIRSLGDTDD